MKTILRFLSLCLLASLMCGSLLAQQRLVIRGGTLVDVRTGALKPETTIVLEGDRIASVSQGGASASGGTVIDATGKYIIPGLIELHAHWRDWVPELFLNHGVTTVVDLGSPHEWIQAQKEAIEKGLIQAPRLFIGSYNFNGPPESHEEVFELASRPYVQIVAKPEDAMKDLEPYVQGPGKVDAIKVLQNLNEATLRAIKREADKGNLPVIGHFRDVRIAAAVGANGIEHLVSVAAAALDPQKKEEGMKNVRQGFVWVDVGDTAFIDPKKLPDIIQLMVKSKLYLNPTLVGSYAASKVMHEKGFQYQVYDLLFNDWRLRYIPLQWRLSLMKSSQQVGLYWNYADLTDHERNLFEQSFQGAELIVKSFVQAGGKLYMGTDCASTCVPGLASHQEMEVFADLVGPLPALQAATINSADLLRKADRFGTVEAGKAADVVILNGNPLEDIRNTRKIFRVISRGRVIDGQYHPEFQNPLPRNEWEDTIAKFPSPMLQWASPATVIEEIQGIVLTLHGTGFIPYSIVQFNGRKLKTTFVSETQITAELPAGLLIPGTYEVTVENPDFGWGTVGGGPGYLYPLGVRSNISNPFLVLVKLKDGAPVLPHPREK